MSNLSDGERWVSEDPVHKRADRDDFARDRGRERADLVVDGTASR